MATYGDVYVQFERGDLRRVVLSVAEPVELGIWAVFLQRSGMPGRVRAFIEAMRERLKS